MIKFIRYISVCMIVLSMCMEQAYADCSVLTQSLNTTNTNPYATASVTLPANTLGLLIFSNTRNVINDCANADITAITTAGLTWVLVNKQCFGEAAAPTQNIEIWRTMASSDVTGTASVNVSGSSQSNAAWAYLACSGTDTSGTNGSGAIVQSVINTAIPGSSITATLAAFGSANNWALYGVSVGDNVTITPEATYAELAQQSVSDGGLDQQLEVGVKYNNGDLTATPTFTSNDAGIIGIEIKAAARPAQSPIILGDSEDIMPGPIVVGESEDKMPTLMSDLVN